MTRVLVTRLDNDGDVLLAGPAIRQVAAHADRVTLLVGRRGRSAAELLPGVDDIIEYTAPWIDPEPADVDARAVVSLIRRVRAGDHQMALILGSFHQSPLPLALVLRLAGVPWIAADCEDYPGSLLDLRHRAPDDIHEVERACSLARAAGFPPVRSDPGGLAVARRPWEHPPGLPPRYVVVHPGASVPARAWAPGRCAALVEALTAAGMPVVVTGAGSERALTAAVAGDHALAHDLGGGTSLAGLAEVLAGAVAVVVGNTGPAHLAAAVGTPVVWLHAPTVPAVRWHPWRVPWRRLARPVPCEGCRARVCPVPGHPCIDDVTVAEVLTALEELTGPAAAGRPGGAPGTGTVLCAS